MRKFLSGIVVFALFVAAGRADEVLLKDGRSFEGKVQSREGGRLVFLVPGKRLVFLEPQIKSVTPRRSVFDGYAERSPEVFAGKDVGAFLALVRWCDVQGLTEERRAVAKAALAFDPENAEAHAFLGEQKVGARWLARDEALRAQGYEQRGDRWLSPEELAKARKDEAAAQHRRHVQNRINTLVGVLYGDSEASAVTARERLIAIARVEKIQNLETFAHELYREGTRERSSVRLEVRLQRSELRSLRTRTISLGTGSPVTLELPETSHVGLGTTVVVPIR